MASAFKEVSKSVTFTPNTEQWVREQVGAENFARFKAHVLNGGSGKDAAVSTDPKLDAEMRAKFYYVAKHLRSNDGGQLYVLPRDITAYSKELSELRQAAVKAEARAASAKVPTPATRANVPIRAGEIKTTAFQVSNPVNPLVTYAVQVRGHINKTELEKHIKEGDVSWFDKNVRSITVAYGATFGGMATEKKLGAAQGVAQIFGEHGEKEVVLVTGSVKQGVVFKDIRG